MYIKLGDEFHKPEDIAGMLNGRVIRYDDSQYEAAQSMPDFIYYPELSYLLVGYCEYCLGRVEQGKPCLACGAKEP